MTPSKSTAALVGLLLILLPTLAILQYRWIGDVSAAERDRLQSSLRESATRFATDFDAELGRISTAFQIRDGFPEGGQGLVQRYQSWSESAPYPQLIRSIDVLRISQDDPPEFYKLNLKSAELEPAPVPKEFENLRDRFRPGPLSFSAPVETMTLFSPIFRGGPAFGGRRPEQFGQRGAEEFRPRGPGGPGPGRMEGATLIELDRDVVLKELVAALVERHFPTNDESGYRVAIATGLDQPQVLYS